jgi:hypothetical protein
MTAQTATAGLLTVKDLPFPRTTVWRLMKRGKLACFRVGRRLYFSPEHIDALLKSCEQLSNNK